MYCFEGEKKNLSLDIVKYTLPSQKRSYLKTTKQTKLIVIKREEKALTYYFVFNKLVMMQ